MNFRDRLKRSDEERKRKNRQGRAASSSSVAPLTDPTNPGSVYYQHQTNHFHPDGSHTSETSSGYGSRSDADYGSRDSGSSSSYDSGSSSYDSGSSGGGSYGE